MQILQEYVNTIGKLSDTDLPSYFGLPENIHRIWEINAGTTIISQLKLLALSNLNTSQFDLSLWQTKLSPVMGLWKKFNQNYDWLRSKRVLSGEDASGLESFIIDEFNFAQQLIQLIHKWLVGLSKVLRGVLVPENDLLKVGTSLVNGKVSSVMSFQNHV